MVGKPLDTHANLAWHDLTSQAAGALSLTFVVLYWSYFYLLPALALRKIPRAGKDPGLFGFGVVDAKRDFKKNGLKILNEGYQQVSFSVYSLTGLHVLTVHDSTRITCSGCKP
jgi:hypothetical protein